MAESTIKVSDISQEIIYRDYASQSSVTFSGADRLSIDFPLSQIGITGYTMIGAQLLLINGTGGANVVNCFTRLYEDGHVSQYLRNTVSSTVGPITVNVRVFYRRNSWPLYNLVPWDMAQSTIKAVEDTGWIYPLDGVTKLKYRVFNRVLYLQLNSYVFPADAESSVIFTFPAEYRAGTANLVLRKHSTDTVVNSWIGSNGTFNIATANKGETISGNIAIPF